eukprot:75378-Pleurochrysis_carterae.AAC.1
MWRTAFGEKGGYLIIVALRACLLLVLFDKLLLLLARARHVHLVFHRVFALSLGQRPQIGREAEHGFEWHIAVDGHKVGAIHAGDGALALRDEANGRALELGGHRHFARHQRLEDEALGGVHRLLEGALGRQVE